MSFSLPLATSFSSFFKAKRKGSRYCVVEEKKKKKKRSRKKKEKFFFLFILPTVGEAYFFNFAIG
jgi:hypothetical protein